MSDPSEADGPTIHEIDPRKLLGFAYSKAMTLVEQDHKRPDAATLLGVAVDAALAMGRIDALAGSKADA